MCAKDTGVFNASEEGLVGTVVDLKGLYTTQPLEPDVILENNKGKFKRVVIVGLSHDDEILLATSCGNPDPESFYGREEALLLLEIAKQEILDQFRG